MDRSKIDAQFSAGIQHVTEAYQAIRRSPSSDVSERERLLTSRVSELVRERDELRRENERLNFKLNQLKGILGRTEETQAYTRTDPRYDPLDDDLPDSSPWGEWR